VVREDGLPYTSNDHSLMHDYACDVLEMYGNEAPPNPKVFTSLFFQLFARRREGADFDSNLILKRIILKGLSNLKMNGLEGFRGRFDEETGRFLVHLLNGSNVKAKPENIEEIAEPPEESQEDEDILDSILCSSL
jgi:hypothetical protein